MAAQRIWDAGEILDAYFLETRAKLLEIAATLDRVDRAPGAAGTLTDPRVAFIQAALRILQSGATPNPSRAQQIQQLYSKE